MSGAIMWQFSAVSSWSIHAGCCTDPDVHYSDEVAQFAGWINRSGVRVTVELWNMVYLIPKLAA